MEARDGQFQPVIKAVRSQAMCPGVEMELGTAFFPGELLHPTHQRLGKTLSAVGFEGDEIIDIKRLTPGEPLRDTKGSKRNRLAVFFHIDQTPSRELLLAARPSDQLRR